MWILPPKAAFGAEVGPARGVEPSDIDMQLARRDGPAERGQAEAKLMEVQAELTNLGAPIVPLATEECLEP